MRLSTFLTVVFFSLLIFKCSSPTCELHLFVWSNYIKQELLEEFEQKHHCKVVVNVFDSNESMFAKLRLGSPGYDLVFPSTYWADLMKDNGMLAPFDLGEIPNIKNVDNSVFKESGIEALRFGIPYTVSYTVLGWRKDKLREAPDSWGIFGMSRFRGRMTMLNDQREALGAALKYLGYSVNTSSREEIMQAACVLLTWKENLAKFESDQYRSGIASAEYLISQGYAGDLLQLMEEAEEVGIAFPKEGIPYSIDVVVLPKDAPNKELAHAFVNFLLEPKTATASTEHLLFPIANKMVRERVSRQLLEEEGLFPSKDILEKAELIRYVKEAVPFYNEAWDLVKTLSSPDDLSP